MLALKPDGVFCPTARRSGALRLRDRRDPRILIDAGVPTFGICLGHQILGAGLRRKTFKMKFGHHGANHPVKDLDTEAAC